MTRLLEDMLSEEDLQAIHAVLESNEPRFDKLVALSGLDPSHDFTFSDLRGVNFCGADLRGFNFTGCDLRECVRNANTVIDDSTIMDGAEVGWIELEALPIVVKMQEVETVSNSVDRQRLLNELVGEFGKTTHVITYMVSAACRAKTFEEFLDFAQVLPPSLSSGQSEQLGVASIKLLRKKVSQSKSRTRRNATTGFAIDEIALKLRQTPGSLAESIYRRLAEIVVSKRRTIVLAGMADLEANDIEQALASIGR